LLSKETTPSVIVNFLDQYVIGQDEAKKVVAVAVYSHYRKISNSLQNDGNIAKSNVLLIGSSGTGKTLLCDTLSRLLEVPFVSADATSLAQTKYVNEEIEAVLQRLVDKADGDIEKAQFGIVFIDEIDKLKASKTETRATSGESVQHALLKIMEGSPVKLQNGRYINTTNILFICGGAFVGLENIMSKTHGFGFISTSGGDNQNILDRLNKRVKPTCSSSA
jgi:ATP-dependent Clp protease ATP-binding subunit ClpX